MNRTIMCLTLVAAAGAAQPASAQCNIAKYGVPDFDQRRNYLPDNGKVHCVPTSMLNWMGYMANRGRPQALAHSSPDWSSMSEYDLVDVRDYNMGGWMGTGDWGSGTSLGGGVSGLVDYLDHYNVGPFIVYGYASDEDWQVKPKHFYNALKIGWLVSMVYGRYKFDGDEWERDGGHCVTLVAVEDACNSSNARVGFKDPSTKDSDSINTQSPFATKWWDISKQTRDYDGDVYSMWGPKGQSPDDNGNIRLIDKVYYIFPLFVLAQDPIQFNGMIKHSVALLNNDEEPPSKIILTPNSAALLHAFPDPRSPNSIIVTAPAGGVPARVWDYDPVDDSFTNIMDLPANPGAFTIDRRGDLILEINGDLHKYRRAADGSVRPIGYVKLGLAIGSLAIDDATDDLYALSAESRRLLKFGGGDLSAEPFNGPLPAGVPSAIVPCVRVACNPADGKPWVTTTASTTIYQLDLAGANPAWAITGGVQTGPGMAPDGLQFGDHGEMKFISGDRIHEWDIDPASGRYVLSGDPHFPNLPASGFLSLARSRSNYDPRIHSGPAWENIENPDPDTEEVLDCPADIDFNGFVNGDDFDKFIADFEAGAIAADFDNNGFVNGDDFDAFSGNFEKGC